MKLLVIHSSADLYGSDKSLLDFITHSQHKITVVLPNSGPLVNELKAVGAQVLVGEVCKIQRGMLSPLGLTNLFGTAYKALAFLGDLHKQQQFDLVYSNTVAVLGGALAAKAWGVPHVWHVREIMSKSRTLSWCFRQLVSALSTRVVCNSGETLAWIKRQNTAPMYSVVWNGFDAVNKTFDRDATRAALGATSGEVLFVLVGRINWWKGQKLLVQAFAQLDTASRQRCRLAIVGSAPEGQAHFEADLAQCVAQSGAADRITVYPHRADIDPVWDAADVVVVPSTEPEPFGRVAIEAMGFAKPVIAAAHGGLIEIVQDGVTGLWVQPNDAGALSKALGTLANDAPLRERLGHAGKLRLEQHFSVGSYAAKLAQVLQLAASPAKNILFVHQSAEMYGSDKVLLWLVQGVQARGFHPIVLIPSEGPLHAALKASGVETHILEVTKLNRETLSPLGLVKLPFKLWGSMREKNRVVAGRKVDLVYSNTLAVLGGAVYARLNGLPHLWHVHELLKSPTVVRKGFPWMVRLLADKVVSNSTMTEQWLLDEQPSLAKKAVTIWNGLGPRPAPESGAAAAMRARLQVAEGQLLVALVGRINRWKGQELLIDAASRLWQQGVRDVHYVIVGGVAAGQEHLIDALNQKIAASPAAAHIKRVEFTDDVWTVWDACDIAVVPSTEPEPFGMVAIEAMASHKPVVVAAHGGLLDIVEDGVSGLWFTPNDADTLAEKLHALAVSPELRHRLGAAGAARQKDLFSLDIQLERTAELLHRMTSTSLTQT